MKCENIQPVPWALEHHQDYLLWVSKLSMNCEEIVPASCLPYTQTAKESKLDGLLASARCPFDGSGSAGRGKLHETDYLSERYEKMSIIYQF